MKTKNTTNTTTEKESEIIAKNIIMGGYKGEGKVWAAIDDNGYPIPGSVIYMNDIPLCVEHNFLLYRAMCREHIKQTFNRPVASFTFSCYEAWNRNTEDDIIINLKEIGF